jgi:hypothetical protein
VGRKVVIPFSDLMAILAKKGIKTATSRNRRYGTDGDWFYIGDIKFDILSVTEMSLHDVAYKHYMEEGFNTPESFIKYWNMLHPRKRYDPEQIVQFHKFKKVEG